MYITCGSVFVDIISQHSKTISETTERVSRLHGTMAAAAACLSARYFINIITGTSLVWLYTIRSINQAACKWMLSDGSDWMHSPAHRQQRDTQPALIQRKTSDPNNEYRPQLRPARYVSLPQAVNHHIQRTSADLNDFNYCIISLITTPCLKNIV